MAIILRKFNMNYISDNALLLIIGMQNTGKSILIKKILDNNTVYYNISHYIHLIIMVTN